MSVDDCPCVYIIDDEPEVLELLSLLLKDKHYRVVTFLEPGELIKDIDPQSSPDLIISDFNMPQMNGLQLMEQIQKKVPYLSVMMVSGHITKQIALDAISKGVVNILEKPVDEASLFRSVDIWITRSRSFKMLDRSINLLMYQFSNLDDYLAENGQDHVRNTIKRELKSLLDYKNSILGAG